MKLRNIIYSLSLLVGVLTLGSCVNDDDVCLPEGKTQVIFSRVLRVQVTRRGITILQRKMVLSTTTTSTWMACRCWCSQVMVRSKVH